MASQALSDILGWVALTKAVNAVKDGVPNPFPDWMFNVRAEDRVIGNSVKYNRTYGTRETARVVRYGAAPIERELQQEELAENKFLHFFEKRVFAPNVLSMIRDYESYDNANKAKRLVANNVKTQGTLFGNSRIVAVATSLCRGAVYVDSSGNILPTSSGASETYGHQIPANNIGTIVDGASANIFGASGGGSWAVNSTNIPLQLRRLQQWAGMDHGYVPRIALYGNNIVEYLSQNDYVLDFLARTPGMQSVGIKDNTIPDGLFGFKWIPAWMASYTRRDTGAKTSIWPADGITFLPGEDDAASYWSMFEGSYEVPTSLDISTDAMTAMRNMQTVFGAFGYGRVNLEPTAISIVMGDTFWPALKLINVAYLADVVA